MSITKGERYSTATVEPDVREVHVLDVHRQGNAQLVACYDPFAEDGFVFVLAREHPRVEKGEHGVIKKKGTGRDYTKGVAPCGS